MRAVLQRVSHASVTIDGTVKSKIGEGLLVLLGCENADTMEDITWLTRKIANLRIFDDEAGVMNKSILDVGGDDRGALALGRLTPAILEENDFECLAVVNRYRPLTGTPIETVEVLREIEGAGGVPITGLVNNSNLGRETTPDDVLSSVAYAEEVSRLTGLHVRMTTVERGVYPLLSGKIPDLFPLDLQKKIG